MRRRDFIRIIGVAAVWPLASHARPLPVIGYVSVAPLIFADRALANIRKGLAEQGYIEGQNVRFEYRTANFDPDLLPTLYRDLVDQKVNVLITDWRQKLEAAKAATQTIPIVFNMGLDPVEAGFVASFNKPGGNITGSFNLGATLVDKRLEIIHELLPTVKTFAYLFYPSPSKTQMAVIEAAAESLGLSLLKVGVHAPDEFEAAFDTAIRGGAGGMVLAAEGLFGSSRISEQLAAFAARFRLPTIFVDEATVKAGGLISYNSDQDEDMRTEGRYVGRILKGEKPAEMPVMQSTKTIMIINLKTAKDLGIAVPNSLLGRADQVIE